MLHHTVQRTLSSDTGAPIPEAGLALLRVATGVIVARLLDRYFQPPNAVARVGRLTKGLTLFCCNRGSQ